jgi:hypothetical protein
MRGMEMMVKSLTGIDPDEMRERVEQFMSTVQARVDQAAATYEQLKAEQQRTQATLEIVMVNQTKLLDLMEAIQGKPRLLLPDFTMPTVPPVITLEDIDQAAA